MIKYVIVEGIKIKGRHQLTTNPIETREEAKRLLKILKKRSPNTPFKIKEVRSN